MAFRTHWRIVEIIEEMPFRSYMMITYVEKILECMKSNLFFTEDYALCLINSNELRRAE